MGTSFWKIGLTESKLFEPSPDVRNRFDPSPFRLCPDPPRIVAARPVALPACRLNVVPRVAPTRHSPVGFDLRVEQPARAVSTLDGQPVAVVPEHPDLTPPAVGRAAPVVPRWPLAARYTRHGRP